MKINIILTFALFFSIQSIHLNRIMPRKTLQAEDDKDYTKYPAISIKTFIPNKNIFIVDTRNNTISNEGYIKNSILLPLTMSYETWFPAVIKEDSNVVLICDITNYKEALKKTESLGSYNLLGYAIYKEIIKDESIEIQVAEYNGNTRKDVDKLVQKGKYLLDVREENEYKETGVIEQAHLIPLTTFNTEYVNVPKDEDIYIFCKGGGRALTAMSFLQSAGYNLTLVIMKGGMSQTIKEEYPLVKYSKKHDDDEEEDDE